MPKRWARIAGFTLIEIAVVLVVVGLLLSGAMYGIKPVIDSSRTATTNGKLERIELALLAYVMQNGCLPCPADGDMATNSATGNAGWSHADTGYYGPNHATNNRPCAAPGGSACNATVGVVPWNTLGIREADMIDGWSSRITYAVAQSLTATTGSSMVRTAPASYPAGTLSVNDYGGVSQTTAAAYVLVSHGRDRAGAFSSGGATISTGTTYGAGTPQGANMPANNPGTFRQDRYHPIPGAATYYDDIVLYRTAPNMIRDCGPNACGNPSG